MIRNGALIGFLLVFPLSGSAVEDPLACVEPDVANTLLGIPGMDRARISRQLPDGLPAEHFPAGFELVGSRKEIHFNLVAFKVDQSPENARLRLQEKVEANGWQVTQPQIPGHSAGGFQIPQVQKYQTGLNLCHANLGRWTALFSERPVAGGYVVLMGGAQNVGPRCGDSRSRDLISGLDGYELPKLDLPADVLSTHSTSSSQGGGRAYTRTQIETEMSAAQLLAFMNDQISSQNWIMEGSWTGLKTSGSAWLAEDQAHSGLLTIAEQENGQFVLGFEMTGLKQGPAAGTLQIGRK